MKNIYFFSLLLVFFLFGTSNNTFGRSISNLETNDTIFDPFISSFIPGCDTVLDFEVISVNGNKVGLQWSHFGIKNLTNYRIEWQEQNGSDSGFKDLIVPTCDNNCLQYCDIYDLKVNTSYLIRLIAKCNFNIQPNYSNLVKLSLPVQRSFTTEGFEICDIPGSAVKFRNSMSNIIQATDFKKVYLDFNSNQNFVNTNNRELELQLLSISGALLSTKITGIPTGTSEVFDFNDGLIDCETYTIKYRINCINQRTGTKTNGQWHERQFFSQCCGEITEFKIDNNFENKFSVQWRYQKYFDTKFKVNISGPGIGSGGRDTVVYGNNPTGIYTLYFYGLQPNAAYNIRLIAYCNCHSGSSCDNNNPPLTISNTTRDNCSKPNVDILGVGNQSVSFLISNTAFEEDKLVFISVVTSIGESLRWSGYSVIKKNSDFRKSFIVNDLALNTAYKLKIKTICGIEYDDNCISNPTTGDSILGFSPRPCWKDDSFLQEFSFRTHTTDCLPISSVSITSLDSNRVSISWYDDQEGRQEYDLQLYSNGNLIRSQNIKANQPNNYSYSASFFWLNPNTSYEIKIIKKCCASSGQSCLNWNIGETVSKSFTTTPIVPIECTASPVVLSVVPLENSADLVVLITRTPKYPNQRIILECNNLRWIYDEKNSKILNLVPNTTYTLKYSEVFDGNDISYTFGCPAKEIIFTTKGNIDCDNAVQFNAECSNENSIFLRIISNPQSQNTIKIKYRDITDYLITQKPSYFPDCNTLQVPKDDSQVGQRSAIAINWFHKQIIPKPDYLLKDLQPCRTYEIEIESLNSSNSGECHTATANFYFNTKAIGYNQTQIDTDQDGIPDNCDDLIEVIPTPSISNLPDVNCSSTPPSPLINLPNIPHINGTAGQIWTIGVFPVEVKECIRIRDNVYSGKGIISIPFESIKLEVTFQNVEVIIGPGVFVITKGEVRGAKSGSVNMANYIKDIEDRNLIAESGFCNDVKNNSGNSKSRDANGFDANGNFTVQPPYPGYTPGDPFDPKYTPAGFDKDGFAVNDKGEKTKYNKCGCDKDMLDINGQKCDNKNCGPYYWVNTRPVTEDGLKLFDRYNKNDSISIFVRNELNRDLIFFWTRLKHKNDSCSLDSLKMIQANLAGPKYDDRIVFGNQKDWVKPGMHKLFEEAPKPFGINMARNSYNVTMETAHISLYNCDVLRYDFLYKKDIVDEILKNQFTAVVERVGKDIKSMNNAEAQLLLKSRGDFLKWIDKWLNEKKYEYELSIRKSIGYDESINDDFLDGKSNSHFEKLDKRTCSIQNLPYKGNDYISDDEIKTTLESRIYSDYTNNKSYINGVERGFLLEKLYHENLLIRYENAPPSGINPVTGFEPIGISREIGGKSQSVIFENIVLTPVSAKLDAYIILDLGKKKIIFSSLGIEFTTNGFSSDVTIGLANDFTIPIANSMRLTLRKNTSTNSVGTGNGTSVTFDCQGFKGLKIAGKLEFCRKYIVPIDVNGKEIPNVDSLVSAYFVFDAGGPNDFLIDNVSIKPFSIKKFPDFKFSLSNVAIDLSDDRNPVSLAFPKNYISPFVSNNTVSPLWRGVFIGNFEVTLPEKLFKKKNNSGPTKISGVNLIFDDGGITGGVEINTPIIPISEGTLEGWKFSVEKLNLQFLRSVPVAGGIAGKINIPLFDEASLWEYEGMMEEDNNFQLTVSPTKVAKIDMWVATSNIDPNSSVKIGLIGEKFVAEVILHGEISIAGNNSSSGILKLEKIPFSNLKISNISPFVNNVGNWGIPSIKGSIQGFGFSVSGIRLSSISSGGISYPKLNFNISINLGKEDASTGKPNGKFSIDATGNFDLKGKVDNSGPDQKWEFTSFDINGLRVDAELPIGSIRGSILFFKNHATFGNGFQGTLDAKFKGVKVAVSATAIFGNTATTDSEGYKYWYIDAMASFPGIGAPIALTGIGGGAYYHMKQQINMDGSVFPTIDVNSLTPGKTASGAVYEPDPNIAIGIKLMVTMSLAKNETAFNAAASLEIAFTTGGGIGQIEFRGLANFLRKPPSPNAFVFNPNNFSGITGDLLMRYNNPASTFTANFKLYVKVPLVEGCANGCGNSNFLAGEMELFISPSTWYLNLGRTSRYQDGRVALGINILGLGNVNVRSYLNIGNSIPSMPPLPNQVANLIGGQLIRTPESMRNNGKGFAFGVAFEMEFGFNQVIYGNLEAGAGFDLMLKKYENVMCSNGGSPYELGINGWYASGQIYFYAKGEVGVKLYGREIPVAGVGIAAALAGKGPNPFFMAGAVGVSVRVCGVGFSTRFRFQKGEECDGVGSPLAGNSSGVIEEIYPEGNSEDVDLMFEPIIAFKRPIEQETKIPYWQNGLAKLYDSRIIIEEVYLKQKLSGTSLVFNSKLENDNRVLKFIPEGLLKPNTLYEMKIKVKYLKNATEYMFEEKIITFKSGESEMVIPDYNIESTYPLNGMVNFYKNEQSNPFGYINLKRAQKDLLVNGKYPAMMRLFEGNREIDRMLISLDNNTKLIRFPIPKNKLVLGKNYKLVLSLLDSEIHPMESNISGTPPPPNASGIVTLQSGMQDEPPINLYSIYFRVSRYGSFYEKMSNSTFSSTNTSRNYLGKTIKNYDFTLHNSLEPFSSDELGRETDRNLITLNNSFTSSPDYSLLNDYLHSLPGELVKRVFGNGGGYEKIFTKDMLYIGNEPPELSASNYFAFEIAQKTYSYTLPNKFESPMLTDVKNSFSFCPSFNGPSASIWCIEREWKVFKDELLEVLPFKDPYTFTFKYSVPSFINNNGYYTKQIVQTSNFSKTFLRD
jgi:hypothetical protein